MSVEEILEAQSKLAVTSANLNWAPVVDGVELSGWPEALAEDGKFVNEVLVMFAASNVLDPRDFWLECRGIVCAAAASDRS